MSNAIPTLAPPPSTLASSGSFDVAQLRPTEKAPDTPSGSLGAAKGSVREPAHFRNNRAVEGMTFKGAATFTLESLNLELMGSPSPGAIRFELYRSPESGGWVAVSKVFGVMTLDCHSDSLSDALRALQSALRAGSGAG
jgi:hypothetical protein